MTKRKNLSPTEEPLIIQQLLIGLRYHIQTQSLLSSRKAKQRIVVWIAVVATVLTFIFAIAR
ncbi:MAG: hypothetical protein EAS52_05140 [Parapedobacter sp.]|nr:MAG: hypothetical protein EAS52_05140 [Parapedobacter sp.]